MPFGLRNPAQTFQRFIDTVLRGLSFSYAYIDDVLIASTSEKKHKHHLRLVFERFKEYGVLIHPSKCELVFPHSNSWGMFLMQMGSAQWRARSLQYWIFLALCLSGS